MDINDSFYLDFLEKLNDKKVEYILIGGLAVAFHGYSRYTGDMDLWVNPTLPNLDKIFSILDFLGFDKIEIESIRTNRPLDHGTPIRVYNDANDLRIDIMTNTFQKEFSWDECNALKNEYFTNNIKVPVIHVNQLIQMKENSKRLDSKMKDLVDAEELKKVRDKMNNLKITK